MRKITGVFVAGLMAAGPAWAGATATAASLTRLLTHQGFSQETALRLAQTARRFYKGGAGVRLAHSLDTLPKLPQTDYRGAALTPQAAAGYGLVLSAALRRGLAPAAVVATGQAFVQGVEAGGSPGATAQRVLQGLAEGLRGTALAAVARRTATDVHADRSPTGDADGIGAVAPGRALSSGPLGRPTGLAPTPVAVGAPVTMGPGAGAFRGPMTGASPVARGSMGGSGGMGRP